MDGITVKHRKSGSQVVLPLMGSSKTMTIAEIRTAVNGPPYNLSVPANTDAYIGHAKATTEDANVAAGSHVTFK